MRRAARVVAAAEAVLTGRSSDALARPAALALCGAAAYGAVMGSFSVNSIDRAWFIAFAAAKTPMLLVVTTTVCLPAYAAVLVAGGRRADLRPAIARIVRAQAAGAIALAALAPVLAVLYTGIESHARAVLANAAMFALAAGAGQIVAWRSFRPLIARHPSHAGALALWLVAYAFVGIQLGWTLRPFVGTPGTGVAFFRDGAFTNAYVALVRLVEDATGLGD